MKKTQSKQKKTTKKYKEPKEFRLGKKYVSELKKLGVEVRYKETCPGAFLYYGAEEVGHAFDWSFGEEKIAWQVKSNSDIRLVVKKSYEIVGTDLVTTIEPEFVHLGPFVNTEKFDEACGKIAGYILALHLLKDVRDKECKTKKKNGK